MVAAARAALYLLVLSMSIFTVHANEDCNSLSGPIHQVLSKDFSIARHDKRTLFCAAFYCSPNFEDIKLNIRSYDHHDHHTTIIYSGPNTVALNEDCSFCDESSSNGTCNKCPEVSESRNVEIHIRIDNPTKDNYENNTCVFSDFFNMTVYSKSLPTKRCEGFNVALSTLATCQPISNSTEKTCIIPACKEPIENQTLATGNFMHQFPMMSEAQTCLIHFTSTHPSLQLFFSPNIRESLYVYGNSLEDLNVQMKYCSHAQRSFTIKNASDTFYILYMNEKGLKEKGFLTIKTPNTPCTHLPVIENGTVENITKEGNEAFKFLCDDGFKLRGAPEMICEEAQWTEMPVCLPNDKEKNVNASSINFDSESSTTDFPAENVHLGNSVEGSGFESENSMESMDIQEALVPLNESLYNATINEEDEDYELSLISIPTLENNFVLIVSVGVGLLFILVATICSVICCRKKGRCGSGVSRKFDTFQNPIYEKPVQVPVSVELTDQEKFNVSESTESSHLN